MEGSVACSLRFMDMIHIFRDIKVHDFGLFSVEQEAVTVGSTSKRYLDTVAGTTFDC